MVGWVGLIDRGSKHDSTADISSDKMYQYLPG